MQLKEIDMNDIKRNPEQPREHFDTDKLKELGESIKEVGLINPITVEKQGNKFEIVAGERRYRGNKEAKKNTIPAIIKKYKDAGAKAVESLIENMHREDLQPLEKAKFLKKIQKMENLNLRQLAKRVNLHETIIGMHLSLLPIEDEIKSQHVKTPDYHTLSQVASVKSKKDRKEIFKKMEEVGVAKTRKIVSAVKTATPQVKEAILKDEITTEEAEDIKDLDEKGQKQIIGGLKSIKKAIKETPKRLAKESMKPEEKKTGMDVVKRLQSELGNTTSKMYKMAHILNGFHDKKVFDAIPKFYKERVEYILKDLEKGIDVISKAIDVVKKDLK